jgi:hypothetical protein
VRVGKRFFGNADLHHAALLRSLAKVLSQHNDMRDRDFSAMLVPMRPGAENTGLPKGIGQ